MATTKAKKPVAKKSAKRRKSAPVLRVQIGGCEVTPLEHKAFTREYELVDAAQGVAIQAEEAGERCPGCDWCAAHGRVDEVTHIRRDPTHVFLGISAEGGDAPFGGRVTTEQFHAIIKHLTAVRDRMVADGALAPSATGPDREVAS